MNCTKVTTSAQSYVFRIPVAVLGLAFYLFAVAIMSPWAWRAARREIHLLRIASLVVGIGFVLYLLYAELFIIGSICLYCTSVHAITFVLFVLTVIAAAAWGLKPGAAWKFRRAPQLRAEAQHHAVPGMAHYPECRMLAIIGSGETSPTMVTVHRDLVSRLGRSSPQAILLATPYAFQENAADVSARAQRYFADSVGLQVRVAAATSPHADPGMAPPLTGEAEEDEGRQAADISTADWVFAGPGSPSYALAHWRAGPVAAGLRDRVLAGHGMTVLASAAAATAGQFTVPVYEIYKAGGAPRWLPGLDLLGTLGLKVALIPHYDNAEGGRYDTRHCYLGMRRLAVMERELPADAAVLGVDEHTAMLIDLRAEDIEIRGRGGVTVRRSGDSVVLPSGTRLSVADLRNLVRDIRRAREGAGPGTAARPAGTRAAPAGSPRRERGRAGPAVGAAVARGHGGGRTGVRGSHGGPGRRRDGRSDPGTRDRDHAVGGRHRRGPGDRAGARAVAQPHRQARAGRPGRAGRPQGPAAADGRTAARAAGRPARRG